MTVFAGKNLIHTLIALVALSFGLRANAAELFEFSRPTRALGMGGVYLPFVSDTDAVFWNPAALARVKSLSWEVFDLGVGVNGKDALELWEIVQDDTCTGPSCYGDLYGKPLWIGYHGGTKIVVPRVGFTLFTSGYLSGTLHNPAFPSLNLTYLDDYGFAAGYGFPVIENLNGGLTVKRIHRRGGTEDISLSTVTSNDSSILDEFDRKGTGYGFDLGLQWLLPGTPQTIVSLHWQDVGSTAFIPDGDNGSPPRIKDNLSLGIGNEIDLPGMEIRTGFEYRHITLQGEQIGKKLHLGAEVSLPLIDLRVGLNQGYPTLGAGLDLFFLRIDAASYSEEVGIYPGQNPSQRYKVGLSMNFSVDADFGFTTVDGKKRKLKQRR
ncbi:MAG: hypothetical protein KF789_14960 [Bdellovibrionaceae bacterium]|nr:hypothetical protein [Pseudobdellovibrionaceae bacterium]